MWQMQPLRHSVSWLDWIFPQAMAFSKASPSSADLVALMAVGGLGVQLNCLNESVGSSQATSCGSQPFMKNLAELGSVGAFQQGHPPKQVFCSVAARGGAKFNLVAAKQPLLSFVDGDEEELPNQANAKRAAQSLLRTCASKANLAAMNVALSYPTDAVETVREGARPDFQSSSKTVTVFQPASESQTAPAESGQRVRAAPVDEGTGAAQ